VALWKEDFEKERADREKAQSELDTVRKVGLEDRQQLHKERDVCRQLKEKLEQAERDKKDLQTKLTEKINELQLKQFKMDAHKHGTTGSAAEGVRRWNCVKCTFINSPTDRYCAMCGSLSWQHAGRATVTPSAPARARHLLHHHSMEGNDACDAPPPAYGQQDSGAGIDGWHNLQY